MISVFQGERGFRCRDTVKMRSTAGRAVIAQPLWRGLTVVLPLSGLSVQMIGS